MLPGRRQASWHLGIVGTDPIADRVFFAVLKPLNWLNWWAARVSIPAPWD
jgi:hypothetical protein